MTTICLNLRTHLPTKLDSYSFFDIGQSISYIDQKRTIELINETADIYYLPRNYQMLDLISSFPDKMKISYTISGITLELLEKHRPDVIESFKALANTGNVEFVCQSYYNSLSSIYMEDHFKYQVELHRSKIRELFGLEAKVIANTEFIYTHKLGTIADEMGLDGLLSINQEISKQGLNVFQSPYVHSVKCLSNNENLLKDWKEWSFTPANTQWGRNLACQGQLLNVFADYKDLGPENSHHFYYQFFEHLSDILEDSDTQFGSLSNVLEDERLEMADEKHLISVFKNKKHNSLWSGNYMQQDAMTKLYKLENQVIKSGDKELLHRWSQLQDHEHFLNMDTSNLNSHLDEGLPNGNSPYDNYIHFMNIVSDLELRLNYAIDMHALKQSADRTYLKSA